MNHCFHVYTPRKDKVLSGWLILCIGWLALSLRVEVECVNLKRLRIAVQVQQSCTLSKFSVWCILLCTRLKVFVSTSNNIFVQYKNWLLISHWHHYFNFFLYWLLLFYLFILLFLIVGNICQSIWPIYQSDLTAMSEMNPCTV